MNDILANKLVAVAARCSVEKDRQTIVEATTALRHHAPETRMAGAYEDRLVTILQKVVAEHDDFTASMGDFFEGDPLTDISEEARLLLNEIEASPTTASSDVAVTGHTPLPWATNHAGDSIYQDIGAGRTIATVCGDGFDNPTRKANAALIIAAVKAFYATPTPSDAMTAAATAYAEVVRQADAIYNEDRNDIQDRRAIRRFADRFRVGHEDCRVSLPSPATPAPAQPGDVRAREAFAKAIFGVLVGSGFDSSFCTRERDQCLKAADAILALSAPSAAGTDEPNFRGESILRYPRGRTADAQRDAFVAGAEFASAVARKKGNTP